MRPQTVQETACTLRQSLAACLVYMRNILKLRVQSYVFNTSRQLYNKRNRKKFVKFTNVSSGKTVIPINLHAEFSLRFFPSLMLWSIIRQIWYERAFKLPFLLFYIQLFKQWNSTLLSSYQIRLWYGDLYLSSSTQCSSVWFCKWILMGVACILLTNLRHLRQLNVLESDKSAPGQWTKAKYFTKWRACMDFKSNSSPP